MGIFSGGGSAAQRKKTRSFSDLKGADAESYVDSHGDLAAAWKKIQANPYGTQGSYWGQRMGGQMSKAAFGEAHRGEDKLLYEGKYAGGTKIKKEDKTYFSAKNTYREDDKVGMRAKTGPVEVEEEEEDTTTTDTTSSDTTTTNTTTTNETTTEINALTAALSSALAAISAISSGYSSTPAADGTTTTQWPGAPDWVKNFTDYRKWMASKSQTSGYLSTVNTSSTGLTLDDLLKNVNVTSLSG